MSEKVISVSTGSKIRTTSADLGFPIFLTAYDPSDLPGSSLDLLGLNRNPNFRNARIRLRANQIAEVQSRDHVLL